MIVDCREVSGKSWKGKGECRRSVLVLRNVATNYFFSRKQLVKRVQTLLAASH